MSEKYEKKRKIIILYTVKEECVVEMKGSNIIL